MYQRMVSGRSVRCARADAALAHLLQSRLLQGVTDAGAAIVGSTAKLAVSAFSASRMK